MPTTKRTVFFKVQDPRFSWEQTPATENRKYDDGNTTGPQAYAQRLANKHGAQVRWAWAGSTQGHYVEPQNG